MSGNKTKKRILRVCACVGVCERVTRVDVIITTTDTVEYYRRSAGRLVNNVRRIGIIARLGTVLRTATFAWPT